MKNISISSKILVGLLLSILVLGTALILTMPEEVKEKVTTHWQDGDFNKHKISGHYRGKRHSGGAFILGGLVVGGAVAITHKRKK